MWIFDLLEVNFTKFLARLKPVSNHLFMLKTRIKSKMSYSESEPDSNFAIDSVSDFHSDSESISNLAFMNLDICIFLTLYLHSSKET